MNKYFLLILFLIFFVACKKSTPVQPNEQTNIPEHALENFSISETNSGQPHWSLDAKSAQIMEKEKKILLQFPTVKFFENGQQVSTLIAESGRINTENYDIWAEGKCELTTSENERLETTNLNYRSDIKKIITKDNLKLFKQNETIIGKGLEASPDLKDITISTVTVIQAVR